jgi:hypothetical protein
MRRGVYWHPPKMNQQRPGKGFRANLVGNYFKAGPDATKTGEDLKQPAIDATEAEELYADGNYFTWAGGVVDPWEYPLGRGVLLQKPQKAGIAWPAPEVETHSAERLTGWCWRWPARSRATRFRPAPFAKCAPVRGMGSS